GPAVEIRGVEELTERESLVGEVRDREAELEPLPAHVRGGVDLHGWIGELAQWERPFSDVADADAERALQWGVIEPDPWERAENGRVRAADHQGRIGHQAAVVVERRVDRGERGGLVQ